LQFGNRNLIIDTKYYSHSMQVQYDTYKFHSNNLYQIFTYVKNMDVKNTGNVSGMLLYAKTVDAINSDSNFTLSGNKFSVKTLDLSMSFNNIAEQLNEIAELYVYNDTWH